jgi:hypothetical protein
MMGIDRWVLCLVHKWMNAWAWSWLGRYLGVGDFGGIFLKKENWEDMDKNEYIMR